MNYTRLAERVKRECAWVEETIPKVALEKKSTSLLAKNLALHLRTRWKMSYASIGEKMGVSASTARRLCGGV